MGKKKEKPAGHGLQDRPIPPVRSGPAGTQDVRPDPAKPVNLDDTIIFDGWL